MSEDEDREMGELDFERLDEALVANREEHRSQVSIEWVETIREAGEVWRELEDVEAVSKEVGLSLETTREALTVYRLIFEETPMAVAMKATIPGKSFFSLEKELTQGGEENGEASVEELLREFVGAVYLEHDIEEEGVGEPPARESPPSGFESIALDLNMGEVLPSFEIPSSALAGITNIPKIPSELFQTQSSALTNAVNADLLRMEQTVASAFQQPIPPHQETLTRSLASLTAAIDEQNQLGQSAGLALSDVVQELQFPEPILTDLAAMQPSINMAAAAGSHPSSLYEEEESVVDEASRTSTEVEPLKATGDIAPATGAVDSTLEAGLPDSTAFTTELVFEIPAMIVEAILSTGRTRTWFTNLSEDHQISAIRVMLAAIALYFTGNLALAALATILAPSVRRMVLEE